MAWTKRQHLKNKHPYHFLDAKGVVSYGELAWWNIYVSQELLEFLCAFADLDLTWSCYHPCFGDERTKVSSKLMSPREWCITKDELPHNSSAMIFILYLFSFYHYPAGEWVGRSWTPGFLAIEAKLLISTQHGHLNTIRGHAAWPLHQSHKIHTCTGFQAQPRTITINS